MAQYADGYAPIVKNNTVKNVTLSYTSVDGAYVEGTQNQNIGEIIGRIITAVDEENNVAENVKIATTTISSQEQFTTALKNIKDNEVLKLAEGTFTTSTKITANNVVIKGAGADKTTIDCGTNAVSGQAGLYLAGTGVTISDLTVKSTSTNGNVAALKISNVKNPGACTVKNVNVYSEKGNGLTIHGVTEATVDNVHVLNAGKCGFAVADTMKATFTNCTVEETGWKFDIGCMYNPEKETSYPTPSHIVIGEGNNFKNGWIYGEYPEKGGDTVEGYDSSWTLTYKTDKETGELTSCWDLKKN